MPRKPKPTLSDSGEFGLIDTLTKGLIVDRSVICGVGDDCAVLRQDKNYYQLFTTDTVSENVHFVRSEVKPHHIGHKALARTISDIAAMGGLPTYAVVSLSAPKSLAVEYIKKVYRGLRTCARAHKIQIVGGDVTKGPVLSLTVSLLGTVERAKVVYRAGAKVSDIIWVSGRLGGSIRGKHCTFKPRLQEARFLVDHVPIHAMIDISDGLVQDLGHICKQSKVSVALDEDTVPIARAARICSREDGRSALDHALSDGEDYELLFTVAPRYATTLMRGWKKRFTVPLTPIGTIEKKGASRPAKKGYNHF